MGKSKERAEPWINWRVSAAREILLEDLNRGGWLCERSDLDPAVIFSIYKHGQEEFKDVPYDQFAIRHKDSIERADKRRSRAKEEESWLAHDCGLHPRQSHNRRGEPVLNCRIFL